MDEIEGIDFYNQEKFKKANEEFENLLPQFINSDKINIYFSDVDISTITFMINNASKNLNIFLIFKRFKIDDDFTYLLFKDKIRGIKRNVNNDKINKNKNNNDKRKRKKGSSFSNQISIGYNCSNKKHYHKNKISIKIFKKGTINITGCKDEEELLCVYNKLYNKLININQYYYVPELNKELKCEYFSYFLKPEDMTFQTEMIFSTLRIVGDKTFLSEKKKNKTDTISIDLKIFKELLEKKYNTKDVNAELPPDGKTDLLKIDLLYLAIFDENKQKKKWPTIALYHTGSINIVTKSLDLIDKAVVFLKKEITSNKIEIFQQQAKFI